VGATGLCDSYSLLYWTDVASSGSDQK